MYELSRYVLSSIDLDALHTTSQDIWFTYLKYELVTEHTRASSTELFAEAVLVYFEAYCNVYSQLHTYNLTVSISKKILFNGHKLAWQAISSLPKSSLKGIHWIGLRKCNDLAVGASMLHKIQKDSSFYTLL